MGWVWVMDWGMVMVLGMSWENLPLVEVPQAPGLVVWIGDWIQEPSRRSVFPGKLPLVEVPRAPDLIGDFSLFLLPFLVVWIGDWVQEPSRGSAFPGEFPPPTAVGLF